MWKKFALGIAAGLVILAIVVATRPSELKVERSQTIQAPADVVFGMINDFHAWSEWSPWERLHPGMQRTHAGSESGVGAEYSWSGNEDVGTGRMTITESQPQRQVDIKLEFIEPWEATNTARFTLNEAGEGVNVTWAITGENNFAAKAAGMFMDMDAMIGKDLEQGFANMKQLAEAKAEELDAEAQRAAAEVGDSANAAPQAE
jgi:carbon monoxide dehydrogenase subunit G